MIGYRPFTKNGPDCPLRVGQRPSIFFDFASYTITPLRRCPAITSHLTTSKEGGFEGRSTPDCCHCLATGWIQR